AEFDLSFDFGERFTADGSPAGMYGGLEYSTDLFSPDTAHLLADRLLRLIDQVSGCRGADRDVVPGAEPGQQGRQGGLHHHAAAHVVGPVEGRDPCVAFV
ncbi:hypothetical protein, partial [Streptomyces sp. E5N298]|uniref:hypothetical protein n=1 Tax=Streptomyces sp. E5N298 TaxID=1851983 RepID=UPI00187D56B5